MPSLVSMIDFASASMDELRALHDLASLVGDTAYAFVWTDRCKVRGQSDRFNAAGELMQRLGDALTDVAGAAAREVKGRRPIALIDRETRLQIVARPILEDGDTTETATFIGELAAFLADDAKG